MENYNKSNPFVIMAKNKYYEIIDLIQSISSAWILRGIIEIFYIFLLTAIGLLLHLNYIIGWLLFFGILLALDFANKYLTIREFLVNNKTMQDYDKLANLEVSEILSVNNEQMMASINSLFELSGSLKTTREFIFARDVYCIGVSLCSWILILLEVI